MTWCLPRLVQHNLDLQVASLNARHTVTQLASVIKYRNCKLHSGGTCMEAIEREKKIYFIDSMGLVECHHTLHYFLWENEQDILAFKKP